MKGQGTGTCHTTALKDKMDIFNVKRGGHELLTSLVQFKGVAHYGVSFFKVFAGTPRRRCQSAEPTAHQAAPIFAAQYFSPFCVISIKKYGE